MCSKDTYSSTFLPSHLSTNSSLVKVVSTEFKYCKKLIASMDLLLKTEAIWIREQLKSGILKGKPILYYKELGEPSHATALDYLINKYNWNEEQVNNSKIEIKAGKIKLKDNKEYSILAVNSKMLINMGYSETQAGEIIKKICE